MGLLDTATWVWSQYPVFPSDKLGLLP